MVIEIGVEQADVCRIFAPALPDFCATEGIASGRAGFASDLQVQRAIISFIDLYAKTQRNTAGLHIESISDEDMRTMAGRIAEIAGKHGMETESCAEGIDLEDVGVKHGSCIDKRLIEEIIGCRLIAGKDKNQRAECGCYESVETGLYNTCKNGCRYCYANFSDATVIENIKAYDPLSPLLCGTVGPNDKITERKMKSLKDMQLSLF